MRYPGTFRILCDRVLRICLLGIAIGSLGCGSDAPTDTPINDKPLTLSVSEVTTSSGGRQAHFSWDRGLVYFLSVTKPNSNGTSTVMWSWEVIDPSFAVSTGITYGATPAGAACSIHSCTATGLTRGVPYRITVKYGNEQMTSLNFTL